MYELSAKNDRLMMVKPQGLLGDINFKYIRQRMEHREKSKEAANE